MERISRFFLVNSHTIQEIYKILKNKTGIRKIEDFKRILRQYEFQKFLNFIVSNKIFIIVLEP